MSRMPAAVRRTLPVLLTLLGLMAITPAARAAEEPDAALVDRISEAVVQKLQESGALDRAVDAGIERYVAQQREKQAEAARQREEATRSKANNLRPADPATDHIYGNPDAEVTLVEYSDFECPFCKRFHDVAKSLVDNSGGKVNWVYRHFPLGFHNPMAQHEAEASECVAELGGNDAFWRFGDSLYAKTATNGKGVPGGDLGQLAADAGVERGAFDACLASGRHADRVKKDYAEGMAVGVSGTPGNILRNNKSGKVLVRTGALPLATMQAAVDELLQAQPAAAAGK